MGCIIKCPCGGHIQLLPEDGRYYTLTENHTIIFEGYCLECKELVRIERPILELMLHCPNKGKAN
jgi:hypothetical protein